MQEPLSPLGAITYLSARTTPWHFRNTAALIFPADGLPSCFRN